MALIAEVTAEAEARGLIVLEDDPSYWGYQGSASTIAHLTSDEGGPLTDEDADAVYVGAENSGLYTRRL